jgi:hypothetical protein
MCTYPINGIPSAQSRPRKSWHFLCLLYRIVPTFPSRRMNGTELREPLGRKPPPKVINYKPRYTRCYSCIDECLLQGYTSRAYDTNNSVLFAEGFGQRDGVVVCADCGDGWGMNCCRSGAGDDCDMEVCGYQSCCYWCAEVA